MPGRLGDLELTTDLGDVAAAIEQLVAFGELANDLFGGVVPSFHDDILSLHEGASGLSSTVAHFKWISAYLPVRTLLYAYKPNCPLFGTATPC